MKEIKVKKVFQAVAAIAMVILLTLITGCCGGCAVDGDGGCVPPETTTLEEAELLWRKFDWKNYSIEQEMGCDCRASQSFMTLIIKDNKITEGIDQASGQLLPPETLKEYHTIDGLFEFIKATQASNPKSFRVEYDPGFGYPRRIMLDGSSLMDDELRIETRSLNKLD